MPIDPKDEKQINPAYKDRSNAWPTEVIPVVHSKLVNLGTEGLDTVMSEGSVELKRLEEHVLRNMNPVTIWPMSNIETGRLQPKGEVLSDPYRNGEYYAFEGRKPLTRCELDVLEDQAAMHEKAFHRMRDMLAEHLLCCSKPATINAPQITLEQAVAVLNERNFMDRSNWRYYEHYLEEGIEVQSPGDQIDPEDIYVLNIFGAIAVAEKYLREAK